MATPTSAWRGVLAAGALCLPLALAAAFGTAASPSPVSPPLDPSPSIVPTCLPINCPADSPSPSTSPVTSPSVGPSAAPSPSPTRRPSPRPTPGGTTPTPSPTQGQPPTGQVTDLSVAVDAPQPIAGQAVKVTAIAASRRGADTTSVPGIPIHFEILGQPTPPGSFIPADATTDGNGIASALLITSSVAGDTRVRASTGTVKAELTFTTVAPRFTPAPFQPTVTSPPSAPADPGAFSHVVSAVVGMLLPIAAAASIAGRRPTRRLSGLRTYYDRHWSDLQRLMAR